MAVDSPKWRRRHLCHGALARSMRLDIRCRKCQWDYILAGLSAHITHCAHACRLATRAAASKGSLKGTTTISPMHRSNVG